jgi:transcriptional regulator GlxA family with amidase domain
MTESRPSHGGDAVTPLTPSAFQRERVSIRRRRSRHGQRSTRWLVRSRNRRVKTFALCTGVLLLMALGLYFGLARQATAPADGATRGGAFRRTSMA